MGNTAEENCIQRELPRIPYEINNALQTRTYFTSLSLLSSPFSIFLLCHIVYQHLVTVKSGVVGYISSASPDTFEPNVAYPEIAMTKYTNSALETRIIIHSEIRSSTDHIVE